MVPSISATKVCCGATASGRPWGKPPLVWWKSLGVVQRDLPDGALAHDDAVVLDKLVHRLGEGPQSDAKSVTARCNRREQPLAFTPALRTNGRSLLLPCRYCGSVTQMSPKVVCQQSFFTLAVCSTAPAYFLLRDANLALGPPLHGLLPQAA